jgi:hypothetical protein
VFHAFDSLKPSGKLPHEFLVTVLPSHDMTELDVVHAGIVGEAESPPTRITGAKKNSLKAMARWVQGCAFYAVKELDQKEQFQCTQFLGADLDPSEVGRVLSPFVRSRRSFFFFLPGGLLIKQRPRGTPLSGRTPPVLSHCTGGYPLPYGAGGPRGGPREPPHQPRAPPFQFGGLMTAGSASS